jgi:hypothetical protein
VQEGSADADGTFSDYGFTSDELEQLRKEGVVG